MEVLGVVVPLPGGELEDERTARVEDRLDLVVGGVDGVDARTACALRTVVPSRPRIKACTIPGIVSGSLRSQE